jgi:hypothetical protein
VEAHRASPAQVNQPIGLRGSRASHSFSRRISRQVCGEAEFHIARFSGGRLGSKGKVGMERWGTSGHAREAAARVYDGMAVAGSKTHVAKTPRTPTRSQVPRWRCHVWVARFDVELARSSIARSSGLRKKAINSELWIRTYPWVRLYPTTNPSTEALAAARSSELESEYLVVPCRPGYHWCHRQALRISNRAEIDFRLPSRRKGCANRATVGRCVYISVYIEASIWTLERDRS